MGVEPVVTAGAKKARGENAPLYTAIGLLLVFIMAARSSLDSDMWWHMKVGEWIVGNGRCLIEDVFSYTRFLEPWTSQSWLSGVILYLFHRTGGMAGLSIFTAILAVTSMGLLYPRLTGHSLYKSFILVLMVPLAALVWTARPGMFSLVLLALWGLLLDRFAAGRLRTTWLMIPLMCLWGNLHAGYALGLILMGAWVAGAILDHAMGHGSETLSYRQIVILAGLAAGGWLSTAINPNGINTWLIPFITVNISSLQSLIPEWASPDFHDPLQMPFVIILLILFFAVGNSRRRLTGIEMVTTGVFMVMAFTARRNFAPFAIAVAPILSRHLWFLLVAWYERAASGRGWLSQFLQPRRAANQNPGPAGSRIIRSTANTILIVVLAAAGAAKLAMVSSSSTYGEPMRQLFPVGAVDWIRQNQPEGRMLSTYGWGGYLIWNLPEYPVFVDGRTDLYTDEIIQEWLSLVQARPGWQAALEKWEISLVLLEPGTPLLASLKDAGWRTVYSDTTAVLLQE